MSGHGSGRTGLRGPQTHLVAGSKSLLQDEVDEIEVYGSEAQSGTQLATYSFEVRQGKPPTACPPIPIRLPLTIVLRRCVTASSTSDPVPMLPWASLPFSPKRCQSVGGAWWQA